LPGLLAKLSPNPKADVWGELWSRVCHQGTVYSASPHILPHLLRAASAWPAVNRATPLVLAASIISSDHSLGERDLIPFHDVIVSLHSLTMKTLSTCAIEDTDYIYLLQSALAYSGDKLWGHQLDRLTSGEFEGSCPNCDTPLYLVIGEEGFFSSSEEWVNQPGTRRIPIEPSKAQALPSVGVWLYETAFRSAHTKIASWILHLFGTTHCSDCSTAISVSETIAGGA
jgi:hypothetical protein